MRAWTPRNAALFCVAVLSSLAKAQSVSGALTGSQASSRSTSASSLATTNNIGDDILAGLGQSSSVSVQVSTSIPTTVTVNSSTARTTSQANVTDCQAAQVSWSSKSASILAPYYTNKTLTYTITVSANISYGSADVYSPLISGYTHANGVLSVTSATELTTTYLSPFTAINTLITPSGLSIPPSPTCTIDPASCSALYSAYSSSLGLTGPNATFPYISPAPTNSPRCRTTSGCTYYSSTDGCTVSGRSVHVFYWPPEPTTTAGNRNATRASNTTAPRTVITSGITMTSPSVYLSFDLLSAFTYFDGGRRCDSFAAGAIGFAQIGSTHTNSWISIMPRDVSTLEKLMAPYTASLSFPDAALTAMGKANASDYSYWASAISVGGGGVTSSRLDFEKLTRPDARAYYLRVFDYRDLDDYAQGCFPFGPHPGCNTIFDGAYRAQLSLPREVRNIDPAWSTCGPVLYGVRDPPIALTGAESANAPADSPSTTTLSDPTTTPPSPSLAPADPTVSPTALPVVTTSTSSLSNAVPAGNDPAQGATSSSSERRVSSAIVETPAESLLVPEFTSSTTAVVTASQAPASADPQAPQVVTFSSPAAANTPQQTAGNALEALTQTVPAPVSNAGASAAPVAVITAGGSTVTASSVSGNVIVGSVTLSSGQVATINGATISNAATAVVVQPASPPADPASVLATAAAQPVQPTVIATVGSQSIIAQPGSSAVVIGTATVSQGQVTTISGTVVSVGTSAVVVGSSTIALPTPAPVAPLTVTTVTTQQPSIVVAGSTITADSTGAFVIGSSTASAGGPAVTTAGTTLSVGPSGSYVVVNGQTSTLTRPTTRTIVLTIVPTGSVNAGATSTTAALRTSYTGSAAQTVFSKDLLLGFAVLAALISFV